jgi:hypothetical protein
MDNLSARHQLVCAIVHGYSDAAVALADTLGVRLPEYDQVVPAPDSHYTRDGGTIYTDATVRLLRKGEPVFFLTPEMLERLRELEAFRSYEAKVEARAEAKAEAKADAKVKEAEAKAKAEVREAEAKVKAEVIAANLKDFLVSRGDKPSKRAFKTISACRDADELDSWLRRAYQGETSAQLFPEPKVPQAPTS